MRRFFVAGWKPADINAGKMPAVFNAGKMPGVFNAGKMPAVLNAGKMPAVLNTGKMPAVKSAGVCAILFFLALLPACRQDMHDQGRYEPLEATQLFDDGRSARPLVEGTVPRGFAREDTVYYTGKTGNFAASTFPFEVTEKIMLRGQERYNIYCSPCHDKLGTGKGMIVQRGYRAPPSLHIERLQLALHGHYFDVMTNGFGAMPSYARQISVEDRWAIIAYIRALQYSQNATVDSIPAEERSKLERETK